VETTPGQAVQRLRHTQSVLAGAWRRWAWLAGAFGALADWAAKRRCLQARRGLLLAKRHIGGAAGGGSSAASALSLRTPQWVRHGLSLGGGGQQTAAGGSGGGCGSARAAELRAMRREESAAKLEFGDVMRRQLALHRDSGGGGGGGGGARARARATRWIVGAAGGRRWQRGGSGAA
jgi:hypothetical protein